MKPTRRQFMAASATAATMGAAAAATEPDPAPEPEAKPSKLRSRWREFRSVVIDEGGHYYEGFGMTLGKAIGREVEIYERSRDHEVARGVETPASFAESYPDTTVWEGYRIVAMLRPQADGEMKIIRL